MAAHRRKDEWLHAFGFPEIGHSARDGGDIGDPAAAYADCNARSRRKPGSERRLPEFARNCQRDIGKMAVHEFLTRKKKAGKRHDGIIAIRRYSPHCSASIRENSPDP